MSKNKPSTGKLVHLIQSGSSIPLKLRPYLPAGVVVIFIFVFIAYFPSLNGKFIWDDHLLLTENQLVQSPDGLYDIWCSTESPDFWPATNTTFWIEWRLWGANSAGYHVTNLIVHVVESFLIWIVLRKLSIPGAFLAAVIFAVHPVNVESVAWIAQRKNLMAMLFFLLSILWYLKFLEHNRPWLAAKQFNAHRLLPATHDCLWYWLSVSAFILATLSKGSAAILPVLLLGIVWWLRTSKDNLGLGSQKPGLHASISLWDLLQIAPFFIVAAVLTRVNVWFQTHGSLEAIRTIAFPERMQGAGAVPWFYLYKALLPIDLAFVYPQWRIETANLVWWLPLLAALAITAMLWWYRKSWSRPLLFAWGYFCVALAPVMGFTDVFFMRFSLVADHFQHIALIGVVALAAAGWTLWRQCMRGKAYKVVTTIAVLTAGAITLLTWRQSGLYRNEITLYMATLKANPSCWMAENNLGKALFDQGSIREAIKYYQKALNLRPDYPEAHNNLGIALFQTGQLEDAEKHYKKALLLKSDYPEANNNMGNVLLKKGQVPSAIGYFLKAISLKSDYAQACNNLGSALVLTGRPMEAIEYYQQALKIDPDYPEAHCNLADALVQTGQPGKAIEHYQKAVERMPNFPDVYNNLGNALIQAGRPLGAIEHCEEALRLKPNFPEAHYNLGVALVQTNRPLEAIEHYEQALRLKPDYPAAQNNMGTAMLQTGRLREAIEHYRKALELKPEFVEARFNLAIAYAGRQQSSAALESAQKALEIARSRKQPALASQIENWLNKYRASLPNLPKQQLPLETAYPH
jgi:protein O-mannosyl-transferase